MKNTATYLNFKYRINQLRDSEKWFVINRLVSFINYERLSDREQFIDEDNKVAESDEDEMWKLGFHESVNFMLQELEKIRKQYI